MLQISVVTNETSELLEQLLALFLTMFPEDARYTAYIRQCVAEPVTPLAIRHQWLIQWDGEPVGFRLFNYMRRASIGFDRYMGLLPHVRGLGLGHTLHRLALDQIAQDARAAGLPPPDAMVAEVDPPNNATSEPKRLQFIARANIVRRLGALPLDVAYIEPPMIQGVPVDDPALLEGVGLQPMMLWFTPLQPGWRPDRADVERFVLALLVDNYRMSHNSPIVQQVLASIPGSNPVLKPPIFSPTYEAP